MPKFHRHGKFKCPHDNLCEILKNNILQRSKLLEDLSRDIREHKTLLKDIQSGRVVEGRLSISEIRGIIQRLGHMHKNAVEDQINDKLEYRKLYQELYSKSHPET